MLKEKNALFELRVQSGGLQRDVVFLCWPIAPSYARVPMRVEGGEGLRQLAGPQPMSTALHITWHRAQINFGDLPPYLTYGYNKFKGLVAVCHSFCLFFIFYNLHTIIQSHSYNTFAEASLHLLIACKLSGTDLPVVPSRESNKFT
jgi:hypothetical protein